MIKILCPKCGALSSMSLVDPNFQGPYKCWKCKEYFNLVIHNNKVESCQPLTAEELQKQQEIENLKAKFRRPA